MDNELFPARLGIYRLTFIVRRSNDTGIFTVTVEPIPYFLRNTISHQPYKEVLSL